MRSRQICDRKLCDRVKNAVWISRELHSLPLITNAGRQSKNIQLIKWLCSRRPLSNLLRSHSCWHRWGERQRRPSDLPADPFFPGGSARSSGWRDLACRRGFSSFCARQCQISCSFKSLRKKKTKLNDWKVSLQGRQHVARADDVDADPRVGPFHRQAGCQMTDCRLGRVIRCLRLRNIDYTSRHGPNEDHASFGLPFHKMASHRGCVNVGS